MPRVRHHRHRTLLGTVVVFAALAALLSVARGHVQESVSIEGRALNGTSTGPHPAGLEVALHRFDPDGEVSITNTRTDSEGHFQFEDVVVDMRATYAVAADYREVLYSVSLNSAELNDPVELVVYELTDSLDDIRVGTDALLLSGADGGSRTIRAHQVVTIHNEGDRTFMPDLTRPAAMRFLRFSLPEDATDLQVSSDMGRGDVITIGTGFALTAPVTPGAHQTTYSYHLGYAGRRLVLERSFPMGAESFRLLVEDGSGVLTDPGLLTPLPPTVSEGQTYSVWAADDLTSGTRLGIEIKGLPGPSFARRLRNALTDGSVSNIAIPAGVGLVLGSLVIYALVFRQPSSRPRQTVTGPAAQPTSEEHRSLVDSIARLDETFRRGEIERDDYVGRRRGLKERLIHLAPAADGE